jgi:hypothetical protein
LRFLAISLASPSTCVFQCKPEKARPASTRPIVKHIFGTSRGRIGGLELPPKMVQQRMRHASIVIARR